MKERITFIHTADEDFDPEQLEVSPDSLHIKSLKAAREERLTFSLEELPDDISRALQKSHQLHLRWVSDAPYPSVAPFLSRLSSGLHVHFTPQSNRSADLLHPVFLKALGESIQCTSKPDKFIPTPTVTSRFTASSAFQCYETLPSLEDFIVYFQETTCPKADAQCMTRANRLRKADYLDVDFDAISRNLILTSFRHAPTDSDPQDERINRHQSSAKVEVGVLTSGKVTEREELSLEGFLTVIGENQRPNPTRFSFPSRYHSAPLTSNATFLTTIPPPTGLHPNLRLTFPSTSLSPPAPACALHTYLTLPSPLFMDKYQLSSPNFLASKNLRAVRALSGETDLEAPNWVIRKWGSALLLELAPPTPNRSSSSSARNALWHADVPLHLRYLSPALGGVTDIEVPWPVVFWACPANEGTKMNVNPFDRVNLGYESLFGPRTMFYHFQPQPTVAGGRLMEKIHVPVMVLEGTRWVENGTVGVALLGAMWVVWKLFRVWQRSGRSTEEETLRKTQ
ncbi:MAG: hypothetical protein Q9170_000250 [Blastenia crenularia]